MGQHALLSPSSADRWMTCLGAPLMEQGLPDNSSEYSDEGTAAHLLGSASLGDGCEPSRFLHCKISVGSSKAMGFDGAVWCTDPRDLPPDWKQRGRYPVDTEMVDAVGKYVDDVRRYQGDGILMAEQRVSISGVTGEGGAFGTSDAVVIRGTELQVHDLKYGMGVKVDAKENRQLRIYALGVLDELEVFHGPFDKIRLVVHQPRLDHLSDWDCTVAELEAFREEARQAADDALAIYRGEAQPMLTPSEEGCRWCKAKATCPSLAQYVLDQTAGDFTEIKRFPIAVGHLRQEDPELLSRKMKAVGLIEDFCKAVRAEIERRLFSGDAIPGFKIVQGKKGNRSWTNADTAEALLKKMRLRLDEMYKMTLVSPPTIEKLLKKEPRRWNRVLKADLIEQRDGQPSVAPESDPRPVWTPPDTADDYTAVTTTEDLA